MGVVTQKTIGVDKIRQAVADYMASEGCGCCERAEHSEQVDIIAKILDVPRYGDGSGWDFSRFETELKPQS